MAELDEDQRCLMVKLVYYGPAMSGKTTNLMQLHEQLSPQRKGELMTLETRNDRTLFFDLLPLGFSAPSGLQLRFKLFTVPGQVAHDGTRKAVLSRADGVVFVADSQRAQSVNNGESFRNLAENAAQVGIDFAALPLVVQFNKRDLPDIVSEQEVLERWKHAGWPVHFASATQGNGVSETFTALLHAVYRPLDAHFSLHDGHGLTEDAFVAGAQAGGAA